MKRPLAVFGFSYLVIQMLIVILPQETWLFLVAVLLLSFIITLVAKKEIYKNFLLIIIACALGFTLNSLYVAFNVRPVQSLIGQNINATAKVLTTSDGYNEEMKYAQLFVSDIHNMDAPNNITFRTSAIMPNVKPGEIVKFTADVSEIETEYKSYNYAKAMFVTLENIADVEYVGTYSNVFLIASKIQSELATSINEFLPPISSGIVNAMALGGESYILEETENVFRNAGISHVLVVSGLHISLVCGVGFAFFSRFVRKKFSSAFVILLSLAFIVVTGITPSSIRACTIMIIFYSAVIFNKKSDVFTSLGFAALILCTQNPYAAVDASTLLSFSATIAVLLAASFVNERKMIKNINGQKETIVDTIIHMSAIPFAASIATLPVLIMFGFSFSLVGVLTNIIVINFIPVIVIGGIILSLSAQIAFFNVISVLIGAVVNFFVAALYFVADILGNLPGAVIYVSGISALATIIFTIALLLLGKKLKLNAKFYLSLCAIFVLLCGTFYYAYNINTASVQIVASGTHTSVIIAKNQKAALVFAGRQTDLDDIEYAMQKYNINGFDIIFDLRISNETGNLRELFNCDYIVKAQDIINNNSYTILSDVNIDVFHQEFGNYASINIDEKSIGIAYNRVDMSAYEPCDIFIANNAAPSNLSCNTIWVANEKPNWLTDETLKNVYENINEISNKLLVRTNTGDYKWEENFFDIE